ncbi:beta-glucoside-specific PTS transporter subunit IIABC [Paenibacillus silvae]|uniref:beta-glucoside-specific PTS transporter subunit IIABC n=1 Tax=Paenibacillus silvae TaxID=1325358 RepID=UPI002003967F|nr:beta-glucoside-specific PTS transporter subunit IIABC [Paenibacillus silvae]MCK6076891.1 beta-glucoside-specific PTS transporter subunit IIABC [Paenibacillus silvae]MCK6152333.1 beta-glucoside-specific PTS transporter subunit IIABC [Paenibacillus silvae]MCK6269602.1 beta-glucoside-specific PTS transporter subunit IIABC [Paenibacillus silvae]
MKHESTAAEILKLVGGEKNVDSVTHCATRLRFNLKDEKVANDEALKNVQGVVGVASSGGQYQVIIGNEVNNVYKALTQLGNFAKDNDAPSVKKGKLTTLLDTISGIFTPILPAMIGCAMIKAVLLILKTFDLVDLDGQFNTIMTFIGDAAYYFLPMLLAWSAAVKLKANVGFALTIAGVLLHPTFAALMTAGKPVSFLGLPVTPATYTSSVIPIILAVWILSYVERFAEKYSPSVIKSILKPLIVILVMAPLTLIVLGPIGAIAGNYLASAVSFVNTHAGWLVSGIIGGAFPFLIMTGMHYSLGPVVLTAYAQTKTDSIVGPGMLVHNISQGAAALAVALRTKNKAFKQVAYSTSVTALLGITEPALFGVNLRLKKPLIAVVIGGIVAGIYVGLFGVARSALGIAGIATLPAFITDHPWNLVHAAIGCVIAFVVTFIMTLILGFEDVPEDGKNQNTQEKSSSTNRVTVADVSEHVLTAPLTGKVLELSTIKDEAFASGAMGKGVAIKPEVGKLVAPADGVVSAVFPTSHAIGISTNHGAELLVHIGMNTVKLKGEHFKVHVQEGNAVKAGDLLIEFDTDAIASKGFDLTTPIIVTNSDDFLDVISTDKASITIGERLIKII